MRSIFFLFIFGTSFYLQSQSFYFGPKVGPGLGFQKWNETDNDALFTLNADLFIESAPIEGTNIFYSSLGWRTRGSSWRFSSTNPFNVNSFDFKFRNVVLELGAKKMLSKNQSQAPYYFLGIRGEFTASTNLSEYDQWNSLYFPNKSFAKKFVYGLSFGGGYEFGFREFTRFFVEIGLHPDISQQYYQPPISSVVDPFFPGQTRTLPERVVRNLSLELKFAMKFLRKVEYY
ncbi:MAG TPA: hypothetical protein PLQ57_03255 [Saprospiraceae bacterium]|nr:hypothetical protein [Saprospiraceae bacterium]HRG66698.1 hypothetical protein [Saprospiraceae bacterium]